MLERKLMPTWVLLVLCLSMLITCWDALFVLLRPASLPGGVLASLWLPYAKYITVDTAYRDMHNHFVVAQAIMTLFEIAIGLVALAFFFLKKEAVATLLTFSSLLLTGTKTIMIFVIEAVAGFVHVEQNTMKELILLYIIPNGVWVIVPFIAVLVLGRRLLRAIEL